MTQIEFQVGLFFMPRVGFNPGEALDFLFGWFNLDLFGDDLSSQAAAAIPAPQRPAAAKQPRARPSVTP
jgi:hypothetical protein